MNTKHPVIPGGRTPRYVAARTMTVQMMNHLRGRLNKPELFIGFEK